MELIAVLAAAFGAVVGLALAWATIQELRRRHRASLERRSVWVDRFVTSGDYTYISVQRIAETRFATHLLDERHVGVVWHKSVDWSERMRTYRLRAFALIDELNE